MVHHEAGRAESTLAVSQAVVMTSAEAQLESNTGSPTATGTNLTLPLGLATALLGLGGLSVLGAQRRRSRIPTRR